MALSYRPADIDGKDDDSYTNHAIYLANRLNDTIIPFNPDMSIGVKVTTTYTGSGIEYTKMKFDGGEFEKVPLVVEGAMNLAAAENTMIQEIVRTYNNFSSLMKAGTVTTFQRRVVEELSDLFLMPQDKPQV